MDMDKEQKAFFITIIGMVVMLIWSLGVFVGLNKLETIKDNKTKEVHYEINHSHR